LFCFFVIFRNEAHIRHVLTVIIEWPSLQKNNNNLHNMILFLTNEFPRTTRYTHKQQSTNTRDTDDALSLQPPGEVYCWTGHWTHFNNLLGFDSVTELTAPLVRSEFDFAVPPTGTPVFRT